MRCQFLLLILFLAFIALSSAQADKEDQDDRDDEDGEDDENEISVTITAQSDPPSPMPFDSNNASNPPTESPTIVMTIGPPSGMQGPTLSNSPSGGTAVPGPTDTPTVTNSNSPSGGTAVPGPTDPPTVTNSNSPSDGTSIGPPSQTHSPSTSPSVSDVPTTVPSLGPPTGTQGPAPTNPPLVNCAGQTCDPLDNDACSCRPGLQCRRRQIGQFICSQVSRVERTRLSSTLNIGGAAGRDRRQRIPPS